MGGIDASSLFSTGAAPRIEGRQKVKTPTATRQRAKINLIECMSPNDKRNHR
jgi:hypothetical protein